MPIYEYRCGDCRKRVTVFFPSFSVAEERIAAGENRCPSCGGANLSRLMSRFYSIRGEGDADDMAEAPDKMFAGLDEDDPRSVARWARRMKDSMGAEADFGPDFDQALSRIEAGEDPDKVMDDVDLGDMDMGSPDEALDDADDF